MIFWAAKSSRELYVRGLCGRSQRHLMVTGHLKGFGTNFKIAWRPPPKNRTMENSSFNLKFFSFAVPQFFRKWMKDRVVEVVKDLRWVIQFGLVIPKWGWAIPLLMREDPNNSPQQVPNLPSFGQSGRFETKSHQWYSFLDILWHAGWPQGSLRRFWGIFTPSNHFFFAKKSSSFIRNDSRMG